MRCRVKQMICMGTALIMTMLLSFPAFAAEQPQRTVRVAFPQQVDMTEVRADGSYNGYIYDYLEKIAQLTGWKMEYVSIDEPTLDESLIKALQMLKSGEVDLVGGLAKSPALMQEYEYTQNSYGIMYHVLAAREDNLSVNYSNFMMQSPLRVGLWGSSKRSRNELTVFFKDHGIDYEFVAYPGYAQMLSAFQSGEIDVIPDSP